ncbi:MAG: uracil-DNA glycosylase [Candidatus Cryptobacteroides sp.]
MLELNKNWKEALQEDNLLAELSLRLEEEKKRGETIYPEEDLIFKAFELTPFEKVKVLILGQDPYHNPGQAMGLSFSVPQGVKAPPSLKNIFKEIESDLGVKMSGATDLSPWARQGVLLLNAVLSVRAHQPASHASIGWQQFTDSVISSLSREREGIVFLLWGNYARSKATLIDGSRHLVLQAAHPSPLARGAFFGCRHFSRTNLYLESRGEQAIDWRL